MTNRIGLVEDHARYREVLRLAIEMLPTTEVAWEAADGETALARLLEQPVDLVVVDLSLPTMNGIDLVLRVREQSPETSTMVVSGHTDGSYVERSLAAGAHAYVLKGKPSDLRDGLAAALDHRRYVSPALKGS